MRILFSCDSMTVTTGLGRVGKEIITGLKSIDDSIEIFQIGWGYSGEPTVIDDVTIFPAKSRFAKDDIGPMVDQLEPDYVFTIADPFMCTFFPTLPQRNKFKWIGYTPIDGHPIPVEWGHVIRDMDVAIAYCDWGKEQIQKVLPHKKIHVVEHGTDPAMERYTTIKKAITKEKYGLDNKFVVSCVARNQHRKNIPYLLTVFNLWSQDKEDAILYLHMASKDIGGNLAPMLKTLGIQDRVFFPSSESYNAVNGVSTEDMVDIFNFTDLFTCPTRGEGWGMPIFEALKCGTPVLMPDYSAYAEYVRKVDENMLIDLYTMIPADFGMLRAMPDLEDYLNKMDYWYGLRKNNFEEYEKISESISKQFPELSWDKLVRKFYDIIVSEEQ